MKYIDLPKLNNPVSRFIFGTAIGPMSGGRGAETLLDAVFAEGVNTFDTARVYGESERCLGKWIKDRGLRDKINIITKGCHHDENGSRVSPEHLIKDVETSLMSLGTDYIDLYLLHRDDISRPAEVMIDALCRLQQQGKILCFGASNWTHSRIAEANSYARDTQQEGFAVSSPGLSAAKRVFDPWGGSVDISGDSEAQEWYAANKIPVLAYSALARGYLSGRIKSGQSPIAVFGPGAPMEYDCAENTERLKKLEREAEENGITVAQAALLWLLRREMTVCPIISPTKADHIRSAAAVFDL
ncbi:MAG: aldo/keto reductase [Oscillospiraceae bacterium]|nr:aldo/keto reductase [Oscillospiraceae bacterium]